jgi:hypothetical protein
MSEECVHGMEKEWCGLCSPRPGPISTKAPVTRAARGPRTAPDQTLTRKQDCLDSLTFLLGIDELRVGLGGTLPVELFQELARRYRAPRGSVPETAEAVAAAAHVAWDEDCDDRDPLSDGSGTVTVRGLLRLIDAVKRLEE